MIFCRKKKKCLLTGTSEAQGVSTHSDIIGVLMVLALQHFYILPFSTFFNLSAKTKYVHSALKVAESLFGNID